MRLQHGETWVQPPPQTINRNSSLCILLYGSQKLGRLMDWLIQNLEFHYRSSIFKRPEVEFDQLGICAELLMIFSARSAWAQAELL